MTTFTKMLMQVLINVEQITYLLIYGVNPITYWKTFYITCSPNLLKTLPVEDNITMLTYDFRNGFSFMIPEHIEKARLQ